MSVTAAGLLRFAATLLATLVIGSSAIWGAFALWYQEPGGQALKLLSLALWGGVSLILIIALWQGQAAVSLPAFGVLFGALFGWWRGILPSNDRIWSDDVAQMN